MPALDAMVITRLEALEAEQLSRMPRVTDRADFPHVSRQGKPLLSFSCNDYLGLSRYQAVRQAAADAALRYGAGAGASRLITGECPLYETVEAQLANLKQRPAACLFGSGYLANSATIPALVGKGDLIVADKLVHACMIDGAQLSGATFKRFAHNDMAHVAALLREHRTRYRHCLILTETVFSMDGDLAPLQALGKLAEEHDSWLMTDDAHGLGVLHQENPAAIQMGTLSKAAGAYGGYVCGSEALVRYLKSVARGLVFSTGLPPAALGAAAASLNLIAQNPEWGDEVIDKASHFANAMGMVPTGSAIVPVMVGDSARAMALSAQLAEQGFLVHAIRPPTVPASTARLRVAFSRVHAMSDIKRLSGAIISALKD